MVSTLVGERMSRIVVEPASSSLRSGVSSPNSRRLRNGCFFGCSSMICSSSGSKPGGGAGIDSRVEEHYRGIAEKIVGKVMKNGWQLVENRVDNRWKRMKSRSWKICFSKKRTGIKIFSPKPKIVLRSCHTRKRDETGRECLKQKAVDMSTNCFNNCRLFLYSFDFESIKI